MVLVPVEKTFPRGGLPDPIGESSSSKGSRRGKTSKTKLFGKSTVPKERNKEAPKKNKDGTKKKADKSVYRMKQYAGQLSYKIITEGMLVLGSIQKIEEYQLSVSLPGNVTGLVSVTNISDPYTAALRNVLQDETSENIYPLRDMFKIGQHVVTRVLTKVVEKNNLHKITLSLVPECIYSDVSHADVHKGSVMVAAVKSIEENVYTMDLGIKSTRAFLSKENARTFENLWNNGKPLGIGQLVRCHVTKSTTSDSCTTLNLTADPNKVAKSTNDNTGATLETLVPGMQFTVTISRAFTTGIQVRLSDNFVGYVHQDHFSKPFKVPENYEIGSVTTAKVLYILQTGAVYFTLKSGILEANPNTSPFEAVKIGTVIKAADVISVTEMGLTVRIGKSGNDPLKGFIPLKHTNHKPQTTDDEYDTPLAEQLTTEYPIGSKVCCRVINYNYMDQYFFCTMDESLMTEKYIHADMLELGLVVPCYIKSMVLKGIVLSLGKKTNVTGFVPLVHVSDVPLSHPEKKFYIGQPCMARVLSLKDGKIIMTMKPSLVKSKAVILDSFEAAEVGAKYAGTIIQVIPKGVLVQFYNLVTGWVPPYLLSAKTIAAEDVVKHFYVGQLVTCSIAKKDEENHKLLLSLRDNNSETQLNNQQGSEGKDKAEKAVVVAKEKIKVQAVSKKTGGAEIVKETNGENSTDLKKKRKRKKKNKDGTYKEISDQISEVKNKAGDELDEGSLLIETSKQKKNKKQKEIIKPLEQFKTKTGASGSESDVELLDSDIEVDDAYKIIEELEKKQKKKKKKPKVSEETMDVDTKSEEESSNVATKALSNNASNKRKSADVGAVENGTGKKKKKQKVESEVDVKPATVKKEAVELPRLSVASGFVWDATPDLLPVVAEAKDETDSSDDEEDGTKKKKVKRSRAAIMAEKREQAQAEEARLRAIEQRLMDVDQPPQSADEFDRLVLSSPDSSMVWLQYMAHHLQATEIEKARNVAQRALKTISFREEQEKLNVWVALLNLENLYGTKESLESVLEEAVKVNDAYQVYLKMLQIYGDSHKLQDGDKLITVMTKKFKALKDTWFNAATFYMKSGQLEKARGLLQRALASVDKKEHVLVISRFAQLENKMGSMERAQTLFEQILTTYPKRVDVWSSYVDMLVKSNLIDLARQVLERAVVQKLQSHKMKTLFKKFLAFEEAHGNEESANKVRQMALEYVESAAGADLE